MFGFSKKRTKLARLKPHLADSGHGARSPIRATKRLSSTNGEIPAANSQSEEKSREPSAAPEPSDSSLGNSENWMVLSISGDKPAPRSNHAAAVVGNNMVVVGGDSGNGMLDDVQVLNFDKFVWRKASSKLYLSPSSLPLKIPACKGHCLVSWDMKVLLIGGKNDPRSDRISVWSFDTETECWSLMESKGDIPVARSGHTVVRANSVLILFGGEDTKRRKMNDVYMFDLKSSMWLPLHCTGTGPSARSNHVAALYDDKVLFVFGGTSKSRILNDLYSLDFETMIWLRIKIRGFHPSARAGCCGVLCGTKWYISGGGSKKRRHMETLVFDVVKSEWSVVNTSPPSSITTNKGFSLALVQHKEKNFLVAFGGSKKELSDQVELLIIDGESSEGRRSTLNKVLGSTFFENRLSSSGSAAEPSNGTSLRPVDSFGRQNIASGLELHASGRKSISESTLLDPHPTSGNVSLHKKFSNKEKYKVIVSTTKSSEDEFSRSQATEQKRNQFDARNQSKIDSDVTSTIEYTDNHVSGNGQVDNDEQGALPAPSSAYQYYEAKVSNLIWQNGVLEGQLAASLASREVVEKNLSSAVKSRQETEKKLSDALKEVDLLKERLAGVELAQDEANSLSDIVHSDNVKLEHDVAFLKAVLNGTQKELHSTREVLAGERARSLQLQVEVFHLKQRLQSMENRAPTPRKP